MFISDLRFRHTSACAIHISLLHLQGRPELKLGSDVMVQRGHTADHLGACGLSRAQEGTFTLLPAAEDGREGWQSKQVGSVCQARPISPASSVQRPKLASRLPIRGILDLVGILNLSVFKHSDAYRS